MRRSTTRRTAAGVALALAALGLSGCISLQTAPPPGLVQQVDQALDALRALDSVAEADGSALDHGWGDDPDEWVVSLQVEAARPAGLTELAEDVTGIAGPKAFRGVWRVDLTLRVPGGGGLAPVTVSTLGEQQPADDLAAAEALRALDGAESVDVDTSYRTVVLDTASRDRSLTETAARVRSLPGFGTGALPTVTVAWPKGDAGEVSSVELGPTGPSDELMAAFDALDREPGTTGLRADEGTGAAWPSVTIDSADPSGVAGRLRELVDSPAERGERPRTAFLSYPSATGEPIDGYIGLPAGSPDPSPTWPELLSPPATTTPAEQEAALSAASASITAFLAEAALDGGHGGALPEMSISACSDGSGRRAQGSVLLPVWDGDTADDADTAAFDAVTGAWLTAGLQRVDRASGLDIWAPATGGPSIERATIRGVPEGIRITAEGACEV